MNQIGKKTKVTILGYGEEKLDKVEFDGYKNTVDDRIKDTVKTINGVVPDENGNVIVDALDVDTSTFIKEINGVKPVNGKVSIPVPEVDTSELATKTEVAAKVDKIYVDNAISNVQTIKGDTGLQGERGLPGAKGEKGEKGEPGDITDESISLIESRIDDPPNSEIGKMWLRTDLLERTSELPIRIMTANGIAGLILQNIEDVPELLPIPNMSTFNSMVYSRDNILIEYIDNTLYLSQDAGISHVKSMVVPGLGSIKYIHMFQDGTLLFCTHNKAYYSEDFISFRESVILNPDGTPVTMDGYDCFTAYNHDRNVQIVNGVEMLVWGNYSLNQNTEFEKIQAWYTTDKGKTIKHAYRFKRSSETTNTAIKVRHVHNILFNPTDNSFWMLTGDEGEQCRFMKGFYDTLNDSWTWTTVGSGENFKSTNLIFYEGNVYWSWDVAKGGIVRCPYNDIGDISKHNQIFQTVNDCLDVIMSPNGEFIVTQSYYGGIDNPKYFWYSPDRVTFHKIAVELPVMYNTSYMTIYNVRQPNKDGRVLAGIVNLDVIPSLEDWNLTPGVFLEKYIHSAGFPDAFISQDRTPPVVIATPAGGNYSSVQTVTLSVNEPATIYYTADGSEPTDKSTVYTTPILVNSTMNIKYFGKDITGNISTVKTQSYIIDINSLITTGLVGYWNSKQGVSGNIWKNIAPDTLNLNDATINGTSMNSDGMYFNGSVNYVSIPIPTELKMVTDITLEFKMKLPDYSPNAEIISFVDTYFIYLLNKTLYSELVKDIAGQYIPLTVINNEEVFISITYRESSGSISIYKNGNRLSGETNYGSLTGLRFFSKDTIKIGQTSSGMNPTGVIDGIRIYNRALSDSEVQKNYSYGSSVGL